eukprot:UN05956
MEMKRLAKQGQYAAVKQMAKGIVRMRTTQSKFIKLKCELSSLSRQMDSMQANKQLMDAMKNTTKIMPTINKQMNLPELQKIMQKYDQQQMESQIKQEMIDDAMDDALDYDSDAEDELIQKVMDEIGIEIDTNLNNVPNKKLKPTVVVEDNVDEDLQNRLNALTQ